VAYFFRADKTNDNQFVDSRLKEQSSTPSIQKKNRESVAYFFSADKPL
jgi:hypothetical protein